MESKAVDGGWLVRFHHGDDVVGGLLGFARAQAVDGAWVNALGAIEDPELGYYDLARKAYTRRTFTGEWEIAALVGNLAWNGADPVLHAHVVLGGPDFAARGGHLFAGRAGATCEVFLRRLGVKLKREPDPGVGLALWSLAGGA